MTRVVLSSYTIHYVHAALALHRADMLERFFTSVLFTRPRATAAHRTLLERRLASRRFPEMRDARVTNIWWPEALTRSVMGTPYGTQKNIIAFRNGVFDRAVARRMPKCDVYHHINGIGLASGRAAKARGARVVCDQRAVHPAHEIEVVGKEAKEMGLSWTHPEASILDELDKEYENADLIITNSALARETFLARGFSPEVVASVPLGYDPRFFHAGLRTRPPERFRLLMVGSILPGKGVHRLLDAWRSLRLQDAELLIVGADPYRYLASRGQPTNDVRHIPYVPHRELGPIYASASAFILPSICDSWGLVVCEAMATGCPAIVTSQTGASEAVRDGVNGLVVPAGDTAALADAIQRLYDADRMLARMGARAAIDAQAYTWEKYGDRLTRTYAEHGLAGPK